MDPRSRTWITSIAALFALALSQPETASALLIDNFNEGAINVVDVDSDGSADTTAGENSGLNPGNTLGGVRYTVARAWWQSTLMVPGTASVTSVPGPAGAAQVSALWRGNFSFFYDGIADGTPNTTDGNLFLDLSSKNHFRVDVTSLASSGAQLRVSVWDGDSGATSPVTDLAVLGQNKIPFDLFPGIDFSDVRTIRLAILDVFGLGGGTPGFITIDNFAAVPEPGTALLLGLGLAGLAARRRVAAAARD